MVAMTKEEYVRYLRQQAKALGWLADEIEQDKPIESEWMVDWNLKREREYVETHSREQHLIKRRFRND